MVSDIGHRIGQRAWQVTRSHPMPVTLISIGLAWLLVERIRSTDVGEDVAEGFADITDDLSTSRLAAAAGAVKDAAGHAVDTMKEATGHVVETIKDAASDLGHQVHETAAHLKSTTRRAKMGFWQTMEENPLAVGATVLTLGAIAGFALPSTRKEDELMGETRDQLFSAVKETGQQVVDSFETN